MSSFRRVFLALAVGWVAGMAGAAEVAPNSLDEFAAYMFDAVGVRPRPCTAPDKMERRFCAGADSKAAKLKSAWDAGILAAGERWIVEPVTDWRSVKMLVWRYFVVDGKPIVVQANTKSHSLHIVGSGLPRCKTSLPEGIIEIPGGEGERTPPELKYSTVYAWAFRAHRTGLDGKVRLIGTVSPKGHVQALCLDSLEPPIVDLALSAMKSVRKWRFEPARIDDTPTAARVPFSFDLRPDEAQKVISF